VTVVRLLPEFVDQLPVHPTAGVIYVSIEFATTMHLCCCGCGGNVVLPLRPGAWKLTYDGANVSMWPSVGNWSFACRSHYVISNGRVDWHGVWTSAQVAVGRQRDLAERSVHSTVQQPAGTPSEHRRPMLWHRIRAAGRKPSRRRQGPDHQVDPRTARGLGSG
jgi:hypothetical protein